MDLGEVEESFASAHIHICKRADGDFPALSTFLLQRRILIYKECGGSSLFSALGDICEVGGRGADVAQRSRV